MHYFKLFIQRKKAFYQNIISVFCPALNDTVYFAADGFFHLLFESNGKPRQISEQYLKLKCLPYAVKVITECQQIKNIRKMKKRIRGKFKTTTYYELVHEAQPNKKIRVVVAKLGSGKYRFLSIMPHDRKSKN